VVRIPRAPSEDSDPCHSSRCDLRLRLRLECATARICRPRPKGGPIVGFPGPCRVMKQEVRGVRGGAPEFVGIVVPAHNEADRIDRSLATVRRALEHACLQRVAIEIVVISDSSTDTTADRARQALRKQDSVLEIDRQNAGAARLAGFDLLLSASEGLPSETVWLATTDADTLVPRDWIMRQLRWWRRGADAVAGMVAPLSWWEQTSTVQQRYEVHMSSLGTGQGHPHVHGANLGVTRDAYCAAGGMPPISSGEDRAFCNSVKAVGRKVFHVSDVVVETSTRRKGRAPDGFSCLLRTLGRPGNDDV
jgi:cellulose synthase/poly-beta-1,6-N-acetylglucosamine synthase-like glycosyltransferase